MKERIYFTTENFSKAIGLTLASNQSIIHEVYETIDITGQFIIKDLDSNSNLADFSLFENCEIPSIQAFIPIYKDKDNNLKLQFMIENADFKKRFEYLEKCYNFLIQLKKEYTNNKLSMIVDFWFYKDGSLNEELTDITFVMVSYLMGMAYNIDIEKECHKTLTEFGIDNMFDNSNIKDLVKIIEIIKV